MVPRGDHGLEARAGSEGAQHRLDVIPRRLVGDPELGGDLAGGPTITEQPQNLALASA